MHREVIKMTSETPTAK